MARKPQPKEWAGGYIRRDAKGRATFYIRAMRRGVRYDLSTRAHDERSAHDHLRRFDADPETYAAWLRGEHATEEAGAPPVYLDKPLRDEFLAWSAAPKTQGGKENTEQWQAYQKRELEWWAGHLADADGVALDLREVKREDVFRVLDGDPKANPPIPRAGGVRKKQAVLKSLYGWLRRHRRGERIDPTEDPLADVPNLPGGVAQATINKYVPPENVHAVIDDLVSRGSLYGHALCVQAGTGWHTRELLRFVSGGRVDPVPSYVPREPGVTAVLVGPRHKSGKEHVTKVGRTVEQSARILLGGQPEGDTPDIDGRARTYKGKGEVRGSISERHYVEAVHKTCDDLKIPRFNPAWMRHTNATHAVQAGTAKDKVGGFLGHADQVMVDRHYATRAIPPKVPTIMDDPAPAPETAAPAPETVATAPTPEAFAALLAKVETLQAQIAKPKRKRAR